MNRKQDKDLTAYDYYLLALKELEDSVDIRRDKARTFQYRPKISIITPVYNTDEKWLRLAIESLINQLYDNWELCIVDGGSTKPYIREILEEYTKKDNRIKVKFLNDNKGIAGNSNEALSLSTGELIGFLDHDDELHPDALYEVVSLLNEDKTVDFIYSDEDNITQNGRRFEPHFKPDWSPDTFRSYNYICHFTVIRKAIVDAVGGFREGFDGSQDYDLFLRVVERAENIAHIPKVLYHQRSQESLVAKSVKAESYASESAKRALKEHIRRIGLDGEVYEGHSFDFYRIKYRINNSPKVSIIIPTKDKIEVLKKCINSILHRSSYEDYEIFIIDNQSTEEETLHYYEELEDNQKIRILNYDRPFNYSEINNYAVSMINSGYLVFLNNDTEVISPDWLEAMLEFAQRKDVGAVGALLYYPDDTIQHAGVILGIGGTAAHIFCRFPRDNNSGSFSRHKIIQNLSAVTGACLMMRKDTFEEVGGFDENYSHAFNDIDLCLKIRRKEYLIIYTPYAELYHHESLSRGREDTPEKLLRFGRERRLLRKKWNDIFEKGDPYYNPNLTICRADFSIKDMDELFGHGMQIHSLNVALWEKDVQIHGLKTAEWERDAQIHELKTAAWEKDAQIHGLKTAAWEKDVQVHNLKTGALGKDLIIRNLHDSIEKKDAFIHNILFGKNSAVIKDNTLSGGFTTDMRKAYMRVLIISGIEGAPFIYRCLNLKTQLYYLGYHQVDCKYVHEVDPLNDSQRYDLFVLNRVYESSNITELIKLSRNNKKIVVYSTDDLVTDHSVETYLRLDKCASISELALFHRGVDWATELIKLSDAVIVSTEYLKSQITGLNKRVYVLENALNEKQLKKSERILPEFSKKKSERKEIVLGYFSGWPNDHDYDFATVSDSLRGILSKYDNVKLRIVGYLEIGDRFRAFGNKVEQIDFVPFDVLPKFIADVDINLAPLEDNPHKRSKSAIKFLEAGILGVPTVAGNLEPYSSVIRHFEDGVLCSNSKEWFENLKVLIENPSLRAKIGTNALLKAGAEHTTVVRSNKLRDIINDLTSGRIIDICEPVKIETSVKEEQEEAGQLSPRQYLANKYIKGSGVEIGALHSPLPVDNKQVNIKYVDRKPVDVLREHYPELKDELLVQPDIIGEAEDLSVLPDSSQDFIIANHLLEHSPNPIKVLQEFHRVVRKYSGIIYLALPNTRADASYDKDRDITTLEHLTKDYYMGDSARKLVDFKHFLEWAIHAGKIDNIEKALEKAKERYAEEYSIHYHVFSPGTFVSLLDFTRENLNIKFDILEKHIDGYEFIFILKPVY